MADPVHIQEAILAGSVRVVSGRPLPPRPSAEYLDLERRLKRMMLFARLSIGYRYSIREIARELGCNKSTAERRVATVRKVRKII